MQPPSAAQISFPERLNDRPQHRDRDFRRALCADIETDRRIDAADLLLCQAGLFQAVDAFGMGCLLYTSPSPRD